MTVVVDVGCARYGDDYSIERLIAEFRPDVLYGFDPASVVTNGEKQVGETRVVLRRIAAWILDGQVGYTEEGLRSHIHATTRRDLLVDCFDLAAFIRDQPDGAEIVVKLDVETAEYSLLEHLIETGSDDRLKVAIVEWHPLPDLTHQLRRESIEARIGCELREWLW